MPVWFPSAPEPDPDVETELFDMWLDTKCDRCGKTPHEAMRTAELNVDSKEIE